MSVRVACQDGSITSHPGSAGDLSSNAVGVEKKEGKRGECQVHAEHMDLVQVVRGRLKKEMEYKFLFSG